MFVHFVMILHTWTRQHIGMFLLHLGMFEWFTRTRFRKTNMGYMLPASAAVIAIAIFTWEK
jgi:hypothetical protein